MNEEKLSEYAPELYEALKNLLDEIPIIAGDSRHDALVERVHEAYKLIRKIEDKEELRRCPFCGGEAEVRADENGEYYVSCTKCITLVGYCTDTWGEYETEAEAIAAWNRRVQP